MNQAKITFHFLEVVLYDGISILGVFVAFAGVLKGFGDVFFI